MRNWWLRSLALSLGLVVTGAHGQEVMYRPPRVQPGTIQTASAPVVARAITIASSNPAAAPAATPTTPVSGGSAVSIGKPIAVATSGSGQPQLVIQPVTYSQINSTGPVIRGVAPESVPQPLPVGPSTDPARMGMYSWRRADGTNVVASTSQQPTASNQIPVMPSQVNAVAPPAGPGEAITAPQVGGTPYYPAPVAPGTIVGPAYGSPQPGMVMQPGTIMQPGTVMQPGMVVPGGVPLEGTGPSLFAAGDPCVCAPGMVCPPVQGMQVVPGGPLECCEPHGGFFDSLCCGGCCPGAPRVVFGMEYLLWWMKGDYTPPLLTSGPNTPRGSILGEPGTSVVFGDAYLGTQAMSGARMNFQYWFSDDHCWGLDVGAFFLGEDKDTFRVGSAGEPRLSRPFIDQAPGFAGVPAVEIIATLPQGNIPGSYGTFEAVRTSALWGYDVNLRRNIWCGEVCYADLLFGFRQVGLDESLKIKEDLTIATGALAGTNFVVRDQFSVQNRFYGPQVGLDSTMRWGNFTLGVRGKLGLGVTQQQVTIDGTTQITSAAGQSTSQGGLLAQPGTNIGRHTRTVFGVLPELGMTVGYDVFDWMRLTAGYNALYWNSVVRPGEQINLNVNSNRLARAPAVNSIGVAEPSFTFNGSSFWAHGMTFGMELRY